MQNLFHLIGCLFLILLMYCPATAQLQIESGSDMVVNGSTRLVLNNTDLDSDGQMAFNSNTQLILTGSADQDVNTNGASIPKVIINKSFEKSVRLSGNLHIGNNLEFAANFNYITLGGGDLTLGPSASFTGADDNNYIVLESSGQLVKEDLVTFNFPLATIHGHYMPILLSQSGSIDDIGVSLRSEVLENGTNGDPFLGHMLRGSWEISEGTAGGSNLTASILWKSTYELSGFDRNNCLVAVHDGNKWDGLLANKGAASVSGSNYLRQRSGLEGGMILAVCSDSLWNPLRLDCGLLLKGPYESVGSMRDQLRFSASFPTTEPFSALGYTHIATGGSEQIAPGLLNTNGNNAIVDWVFVELRRNTGNNSKVATRAALLQKDGDIVDVDGSSSLCFKGIADSSYFVSIRHRNHIGLLTASNHSLSHTATTIDFKTTTANIFSGNLLMEDLGDGFFALPTGDFDGNGQVQNSDNASLIQELGLSGYRQGDLDLNGQIQNSDIQNFLIPFIGRGTQFDY